MRIFLKILTTTGLITSIAFSIVLCITSGDFNQFLPKTNITTNIVEQTIQGQRDDIPEGSFKAPTISSISADALSELIYTHTDGLESGKTQLTQDISINEVVDTDTMNRVSEIKIRFTDSNIPMYSKSSSNTYGLFVSKSLTGSTTIPITRYTWENALYPYMNALREFVKTNDNNAIICRVRLDYATLNDVAPNYIELSAFTPNDMGLACNIRISVRNYEPDTDIDYRTLAERVVAPTTANTSTTEPSADPQDGTTAGANAADIE